MEKIEGYGTRSGRGCVSGQGHRLERRRRDAEAGAVVGLVARELGVSQNLLLHRSRCRAHVAASRQLAMYLMHVGLGRTFREVGGFFGRDRTTVSHACARIEDLREEGGVFDQQVAALERIIDGWQDGDRAGAGYGAH